MWGPSVFIHPKEVTELALSPEDRKEMTEIFAEGMAKGIALFRSAAEEEAAKLKQGQPPETPPKEGKNDGGFSLAGFLLGE